MFKNNLHLKENKHEKILKNKYIHSILVGLGAGITASILGAQALTYYIVSYAVARSTKQLLVK